MLSLSILSQLVGAASAQRGSSSSLLSYHQGRGQQLYYEEVQEVSAARETLIHQGLAALHNHAPIASVELKHYAPEMGQLMAHILLAIPQPVAEGFAPQVALDVRIVSVDGLYKLTLENFTLVGAGAEPFWANALQLDNPSLDEALKAQQYQHIGARADALRAIDSALAHLLGTLTGHLLRAVGPQTFH